MKKLPHSEFIAFAKDFTYIRVEIIGKVSIEVGKETILKTIKALQANVTFKVMVDAEKKDEKGTIFIEKIEPTLFDEETK